MKDESNQPDSPADSSQQDPVTHHPPKISAMDRRKFVGLTATAALSFTIVPRHVLGGKNYIAPSDKLTVAYIGTGTEGTRGLLYMLMIPEIQLVSVCDPNKEAIGYRDWGTDYLKNDIRKVINNPGWNPGGDNVIPGGRDNAKSIVESFYANVRQQPKYKGCSAYADARELLDKEKDVDAVKIMTPDHLHGVLAIAAIKKGKHVLMHKPLSNRLAEGKKVIGHAKSSNVITHLVPWDSNGSMEKVMEWINSGAIGTLKEVHNWTNRPVWPQYAELPKEKPPVPKGFNWDLWLGPEAERPYHPSYTHMLFRGWYDFGGGSMADMGHYSLWTVFNALKLTSPTVVEPCRSHVCDFHGQVPYQIKNDFSFPMACMVTFRYPANGNRPPVDLCWYDGGMRPATPVELAKDNKELPAEGMMFIGDKGKILAGFRVEDPEILGKPESKQTTKEIDNEIFAKYHLDLFVKACQSGKQYPGTFAESEYLTEAVNLYAVALRTNHNLHFDAAKQVTNLPEANKYLSREYRPGWNPDTI
jgi:hypothetical protein